MKEITGAGEPSSRSSNCRYFFLAAFFFAFFFFAIVISLRVVYLASRANSICFCTPNASPHAATCDSRFVSKTGFRCLVRQFYATFKKKCNTFFKKVKRVWHRCCTNAAAILIAILNIITIFVARIAMQRSNIRAPMRFCDEISTV